MLIFYIFSYELFGSLAVKEKATGFGDFAYFGCGDGI